MAQREAKKKKKKRSLPAGEGHTEVSPKRQKLDHAARVAQLQAEKKEKHKLRQERAAQEEAKRQAKLKQLEGGSALHHREPA